MQTLSAQMLHETHIGYTWKRMSRAPLSNATAIQVSGSFLGGGSLAQDLNRRERDLEIDDDVLLSRKRHELKFGAQSLGAFLHDGNPNTFNGEYVFGGGSAPVLGTNGSPTGQTTTISGLEQYLRALLGLPGGVATTYHVTVGNPVVPFTQWRAALYIEDNIKITPRLTASAGLRYNLQTTSASVLNYPWV